MKSDIFRRLKSIPPIVPIIIAQATRLRAEGKINETIFDAQIDRLVREELEPKGLTLVVRDLPGGRTRFLVKEMTSGAVCDMTEFALDGTLDADTSDADKHSHTLH